MRIWDTRSFAMIRIIHFRAAVFAVRDPHTRHVSRSQLDFAPNSKHLVVGNKAGVLAGGARSC